MAAALALAYQLTRGSAPFLVLINQEGLWLLRFMVAPLMVIGALLLVIPRATRAGVVALAAALILEGLTMLERFPDWDLSSHFVVLLMFLPLLILLYALSDRPA